MKVRHFAIIMLLIILPGVPQISSDPARDTNTGRERLFAFRNQIGLNLHHFLYWQTHPHAGQTGGVADWPEELSDAERGAIDQALAYYETAFEAEDLLLGQKLQEIKLRLNTHDGFGSFLELGLDNEHAAVLDMVVPVYRRHLWPSHQAANQQWIDEMEVIAAQHGYEVYDRLFAEAQDALPETPIRVDAVIEGDWAGAYASFEPVNAVVISTRDSNQGRNGLEVVFQEISQGVLPAQGTPVASTGVGP